MSGRDGTAELLRAASLLHQQGRFAEAARGYRAVIQSAPHHATSWYNLALCERNSGQLEQALASYAQAIRLGIDRPEEAHLNRAVIFSDLLRRDDEAERELRKALSLNARYVPALLNLANLSEDLGRREAARELYEQAMAADPHCWEALSRYANLLDKAADLSNVAPRLRAALAAPSMAAADKAGLGFALGRALDRLGAFPDAFAAYKQANEESQRAYGARYDWDAAERLIGRIADAFPADSAPPPRGEGGAPIFICGMFRSGSTLAEQVLAGHRRITPCGEVDVMQQLVRTSLTPFPEKMLQATTATFAALAERYDARIKRLFPRADLVTDKWLNNYLYVGLIKRMFPAAKIVHTVRNPLDNVLSVYFLHLDASFGYASNLMNTAHQLRMSRRLMGHWKTCFPNDVIEFSYDDFVSKPQETAEALVAALGLEWDQECLAFHRRDNAVKTASVWQVRQPLYSSSSGRWKNYEQQMEPVRAYLEDLL
ncbi:MAG: sulfotransferase [Hyphomonadaceae bacterium]